MDYATNEEELSRMGVGYPKKNLLDFDRELGYAGLNAEFV
jgi:hypothetical protein